MHVSVPLAALCILGHASSGMATKVVSASVVVTVPKDPEPFPHTWKYFGAGHAALGLRSDFHGQLMQAQEDLGLQGIRQHGIFDDDMELVVGYRKYNWVRVDRLWDRLVNASIKPLVELSFMPAQLANCSWMGPLPGSCHAPLTGPCTNFRDGCKEENGTLKPGCNACEGVMNYQGIINQPVDIGDWYHLVQSTVAHAVDRYGLAEVQGWHFECWNELWGFGDVTAMTPECERPPCIGSDYMFLYAASASAVKSVHHTLKIGGPATEHLNVENFLEQAEALGAPVDFVSAHNYPSNILSDGSGCVQSVDWDPNCFSRDVLACAAKVTPKPFILSEYNVMIRGTGNPPMEHDTTGAAAFVLRVVPQLAPKLELLSYWTFSDIFEEKGLPQSEFFDPQYPQNHYGAMTYRGIKKPVWRAFELLHTHAGSHQLATNVTNTATAFNGSATIIDIVAAVTTANLTAKGTIDMNSMRVILSHWDASANESVVWTHPTARTHVAVDIPPAHCAAYTTSSRGNALDSTAWIVDSTCQAIDVWLEMGSPPVPSTQQLQVLRERSAVKPTSISWSVVSRSVGCRLTTTVDLPPNSGGVLEVPMPKGSPNQQ